MYQKTYQSSDLAVRAAFYFSEPTRNQVRMAGKCMLDIYVWKDLAVVDVPWQSNQSE